MEILEIFCVFFFIRKRKLLRNGGYNLEHLNAHSGIALLTVKLLSITTILLMKLLPNMQIKIYNYFISTSLVIKFLCNHAIN